MTPKNPLSQQIQQAKIKQIWLRYFNDVLFDQGIITPSEHQRMHLQILQRKFPRGR